MELSAEDTLRLNVLLANKPLAIRIDDAKMVVHGLSEKGEAKIALNPSGRDDIYIKKVKELVSGRLTGSPGGYPVFLKRWTRMGQMRDESLEQLLLLGEPEAVVAAVCSPGLTDELARRAWWVMQDAENARRMLHNPLVVSGQMGPVLATYLLDYLPFETETEAIMESVRLVLQPGLIEKQQQQDLWKKAARKQTYLVGFMAALPNDLPEPAKPHSWHRRGVQRLTSLAQAGNAPATLLLAMYSSQGQAFLHTALKVLKKPPTQDVVAACLDCLSQYFILLKPQGGAELALPDILAEAKSYVADAPSADVADCLACMPETALDLQAIRGLSRLGYGVLRPVLRDSSAIGSLMRKKLEPVLDPVQGLLAQLLELKSGAVGKL
jgi:hypothetical protein